MNSQMRRKIDRAIERGVEDAIAAATAELREQHAAELHRLRMAHAGRLAEESDEHAVLINENTRLRSRVEQLEADNAEMVTAHNEHLDAMIEISSELDAAEQKIAELEAQVAKLSSADVESLEKELDKVRRRKHMASERIHFLEGEVRRLEKEVSDLTPIRLPPIRRGGEKRKK